MLSFAKVPTGKVWSKTTSNLSNSTPLCRYSFHQRPMSFTLSCSNSHAFVYFRNSTNRFVKAKNGGVRHHLHRAFCDLEETAEFTIRKDQSYSDKGSLRIIEDYSAIEESTASAIMIKKNPPPLSFRDFMMLHSRLNITFLLSGFFFLQDPGAAVAVANLPSQLQIFSSLGDIDDISTGFASAFLLIFFSELGDKTFFIAALLAARNSAAIVFLGTFGALGVMTVISVVLGRTFHYIDDILPFRLGETDLPVDDIAAVCLLVYFGVTTLLDASSSDGLKGDEEQKEAEVAVSKFSGNGAGILASASTVVSTFLLVFVAEWGDKSFFSTIALAAASSPLGVIGGALAGHGIATLVAVLGGSFLGTLLSEKVIAYIGGSLFLVFAVVTLIEIIS